MASKKRVVCGLSVAAVWAAAIFLLPFYILAGVIAVSSAVCLYEYCAMLKQKGYQLPFALMTVLNFLWFGAVFALNFSSATAQVHCLAGVKGLSALGALGLGSCALLLFRIMLDRRIEKPMETAALTVCGMVYLPVFLSFVLLLAMIGYDPHVAGSANAGIFLAFFVALVLKMSDAGGYFIGTSCGKHKLIPRLSPGKSWEGLVGSFIFAFITVGLVHLLAVTTGWGALEYIRQMVSTPLATMGFYAMTVPVVILGLLGDLLESMFKRGCGVKDSSALFPAMGGFLDTFDSLVFVPVVVYIYVIHFIA